MYTMARITNCKHAKHAESGWSKRQLELQMRNYPNYELSEVSHAVELEADSKPRIRSPQRCRGQTGCGITN